MTRKTALTLFYSAVALVCAAILATAFHLRSQLPKPDMAAIVDTGKESVPLWFEIQNDLTAINQEGKSVKLSDLRGKVWIAAEFFAICPHCAVRNGEELRKIYDEFRNHPDFHITCISVDPENDKQEKLADYAKALGAETKNWWFLNAGDAKSTHTYLEQELKFFGIRERGDPADIEANGRYAHDLGFLLVDREFRVIGKWPLADARSEEARKRDPQLYQNLRGEMFGRIRAELEKNETPGI
ncbi:MAG: SCO family protein [Luteolibacter sp.]|jgi:cytochrome oxidase Cu insertion factor (SCO1/SenC/PrrC family)|nr:SCO family protein [Luteolibacter sp.]